MQGRVQGKNHELFLLSKSVDPTLTTLAGDSVFPGQQVTGRW